MSLDEFMDNSTEERPKKKQKITVDTTEEFEELRTKAKAMCSCPEEWRQISKYKLARLKEWVTEQQFLRDKQTQQSISMGAAGIFAGLLDWASGSKGYVQNELMSNQGWRASFDEEMSTFTQLLSNRMQLAVLTTNGVVNGKQAQLKLSPEVPEERIDIVDEEINSSNDTIISNELERSTEEESYNETIGFDDTIDEETTTSGDHDLETDRDCNIREEI